MIKLYMALACLAFTGFLSAQSTSIKTKQHSDVKSNASTVSVNKDTEKSTDLPLGYPVYQDTGNKTLDDANYQDALNKWIKENPELYKAYKSKISGDKKKPMTAVQDSKNKTNPENK